MKNKMKAVILAGGLGTRISEETDIKPKPMIEIGGKPILWHIMKIYSSNGINDFIICCGYKGYVIKEYFANYFLHMSDVTFDMLAPVPSTVNAKSLSDPTVSPESFTTPSVPDVVSFAFERKKFAAAMPPSASESVEVPSSLLPDMALDNVIPFLIVANPDIEVPGVNSSALTIATFVSLVTNLKMDF